MEASTELEVIGNLHEFTKLAQELESKFTQLIFYD